MPAQKEITVGATPLVLVPGLLCDALLWQPQIAALGDLADCWVADHRRCTSMSAIAADILADVPFSRFALAGLSMGGYVALEIMRVAPDCVDRLALLDTQARPDNEEAKAKREALIALAESGRLLEVAESLVPMLLHADHRDPARLAIVRAMALNTGTKAFVREQRAIMNRIDSRPSLAEIDCPTLVLCGRDDALTPLDRHEEMAAAIADARLEVIDHCAHLSTLEAPERVTEAMARWLKW